MGGEDDDRHYILRGIFDAKFNILDRLGKGRGGGAVYLAQGLASHKTLALKYPATRDELEVLQTIQERSPTCLGVPQLLDFGFKDGEPFVVMQLLREPLSEVFPQVQAIADMEARWKIVSLIGRLVLRRLKAIHACGFVHGDVAPSNILLGKAENAGTGLFLVDFGSSRKFPGGGPVKAFWSTVEYSAMRVQDGTRRQPIDDLESLGYVLIHGLFGDLPWFKYTKNRKTWEGASRDAACQRMQENKFLTVWGQYAMLGLEWYHISRMPQELKTFLICCTKLGQQVNKGEAPDGVLPDYEALGKLLGEEGLGDDAEEEKDLFSLGVQFPQDKPEIAF